MIVQTHDAPHPTHLTPDKPPAMLSYNHPGRGADPANETNLVVHHPRFGIKLKEKMDALGIEGAVFYQGADGKSPIRHGGGESINRIEFIRR